MAVDPKQPNQTNDIEETLFNRVKALWESGKDISKDATSYYNYLLGRNDKGDKNESSAIKPICETKLTAVLDAQMVPAVLPKEVSFQDVSQIKMARDVADIYNDALKQVLKVNKFDGIKQRIGRWAEVCGVGFQETTYDRDFNKKGDVKYTILDPRKCRWDSSAKTLDDCSFFAVEFSMSVAQAVSKYGMNDDNTLDEEMVEKIYKLGKVTQDKQDKPAKASGIVAYTSNAGSGLAYANNSAMITLNKGNGMKSVGKEITFVRMYIKDDSMIPDTKQDEETQENLDFIRYMYPNGRMITFCVTDGDKTIYEDKEIDYSFGFPIDTFVWMDTEELQGKGEVEDLCWPQDRLNRAHAKARELIAKDVSIICLDKGVDMDVSEDQLVNNYVAYFEGLRANGGTPPAILQNNTIERLTHLKLYIDLIKLEMKETARVNDTMINGVRQPGTTSGEQVEALKEDPQSSIRAIQRNFKEYIISMGNKTLTLIQKFYDTQRILKLTTLIDVEKQTTMPSGEIQNATAQAQYAKFSQADGNQTITLLDEAGQAIQTIQTEDMDFEVDIIAGTEIPRSRNETAQLMDKLAQAGLLGDLKNDPDALEEYLRSQDVPNYRAIMSVVRKKQAAQSPTLPPPPITNIAVAFKDLPPQAQIELLKLYGIDMSAPMATSQEANINSAIPAGQLPSGPIQGGESGA